MPYRWNRSNEDDGKLKVNGKGERNRRSLQSDLECLSSNKHREVQTPLPSCMIDSEDVLATVDSCCSFDAFTVGRPV